jgi:hypothetical protein
MPDVFWTAEQRVGEKRWILVGLVLCMFGAGYTYVNSIKKNHP